jgi:hypothetical protein
MEKSSGWGWEKATLSQQDSKISKCRLISLASQSFH